MISILLVTRCVKRGKTNLAFVSLKLGREAKKQMGSGQGLWLVPLTYHLKYASSYRE